MCHCTYSVPPPCPQLCHQTRSVSPFHPQRGPCTGTMSPPCVQMWHLPVPRCVTALAQCHLPMHRCAPAPIHYHLLIPKCHCTSSLFPPCLQMCPLCQLSITFQLSVTPCPHMDSLCQLSIAFLSPAVPLHSLSVTSLPPDVRPPLMQCHLPVPSCHLPLHFSDTPMTVCDWAGSPPHHGLSHLPPAPAPHGLCHLSLPPCPTSGSPPCQLLGATAALYCTSPQGNTAATICALGQTCHLAPCTSLLSPLPGPCTAQCHQHSLVSHSPGTGSVSMSPLAPTVPPPPVTAPPVPLPCSTPFARCDSSLSPHPLCHHLTRGDWGSFQWKVSRKQEVSLCSPVSAHPPSLQRPGHARWANSRAGSPRSVPAMENGPLNFP